MGSLEAALMVPELKKSEVKSSSIVLSTQLQKAPGRKTSNPLVRDGLELVPNLTSLQTFVRRLDRVVQQPALQTSVTKLHHKRCQRDT